MDRGIVRVTHGRRTYDWPHHVLAHRRSLTPSYRWTCMDSQSSHHTPAPPVDRNLQHTDPECRNRHRHLKNGHVITELTDRLGR